MKWTKADIKRCCDAIRSLWVVSRPLDWRLADEFNARFRRLLQEKRREVVVSGLRDRLATCQERAAKHRETAQHFVDHPRVYGDSTPEVVSDYNRYAAEEDRAARPFERLIVRVEAEGLPSEVEAFDPSQGGR